MPYLICVSLIISPPLPAMAAPAALQTPDSTPPPPHWQTSPRRATPSPPPAPSPSLPQTHPPPPSCPPRSPSTPSPSRSIPIDPESSLPALPTSAPPSAARATADRSQSATHRRALSAALV